MTGVVTLARRLLSCRDGVLVIEPHLSIVTVQEVAGCLEQPWSEKYVAVEQSTYSSSLRGSHSDSAVYETDVICKSDGSTSRASRLAFRSKVRAEVEVEPSVQAPSTGHPVLHE